MKFAARDKPYIAAFLVALGSFNFARIIYQTLSVVLQTLVLPGKSVCVFLDFGAFSDALLSVEELWCKEGSMGSCNWRHRWYWQGIRVPTRKGWFQRHACCTKQRASGSDS